MEIDPDTGSVAILRYTAEDDVGTVINPLILEGQIVGGIAQGLGQALMEHAIYDDETGQLVTGSFVDYTMPRADTMPGVDFQPNPVPSPRNPLGCKGAGEAGNDRGNAGCGQRHYRRAGTRRCESHRHAHDSP